MIVRPLVGLLTPAMLVGALVSVFSLSASAQPVSGPATVDVDTPSAGAAVTNGDTVDIAGWAIDPTSPGTGIDMVNVYLDGTLDGGGTLLGAADYGAARPDVAAVQGNARFTDSGYDFTWTPAGLRPGQHVLYVYAHSIANGWYPQSVAISVSGQSGSSQGAGRQVAISVSDFTFGPSTVTVRVGDTVMWRNGGPSAHTATSDTGLWDTGLLQVGQSGSYTFTTAGTFSYHCSVHQGMRGTVTVTAAGGSGQGSASSTGESYGGARGSGGAPYRPGYAQGNGSGYPSGNGSGYPSGNGAGYPTGNGYGYPGPQGAGGYNGVPGNGYPPGYLPPYGH